MLDGVFTGVYAKKHPKRLNPFQGRFPGLYGVGFGMVFGGVFPQWVRI